MTGTVSHLLILDFAGSAVSEITIISLNLLYLSFLLCNCRFNRIQWSSKV